MLRSCSLTYFILSFRASPLGFPHLLPSPVQLQESWWACKVVLIEENINLQVTKSSRGRAGAGVYVMNCCAVKTGTSEAPVALCETPTTPQPLGPGTTTRGPDAPVSQGESERK